MSGYTSNVSAIRKAVEEYKSADTIVATYWRDSTPPKDDTDDRGCPGVIFVGRYFEKVYGWTNKFDRW